MRCAVVCDLHLLQTVIGALNSQRLEIACVYADIERDVSVRLGDAVLPAYPAYKIGMIEAQAVDLCIVAMVKGEKITKYLAEIGYPPEKTVDLDLSMLIHYADIFSKFINSFSVSAKHFSSFVSGLSYFKSGVDESVFDNNILNVANHGQDIYFDNKIIEKLMLSHADFNFCIIGLGPYSLHFDMSSANTRNRVLMYLPVLRDSRHYRRDLPLRIDDMLAPAIYDRAASMPPCGAPAELHGLFRKWNDGAMDALKIFDGREKGLQWNGRYFPATMHENVEILRRRVAECRARGMRVFLCLPPMSASYRHFFSKPMLNEIVAVAESLAMEPGVYFRNFYTELDMPTGMFSDADHLNSEGARAFSQILRGWTEGAAG